MMVTTIQISRKLKLKLDIMKAEMTERLGKSVSFDYIIETMMEENRILKLDPVSIAEVDFK